MKLSDLRLKAPGPPPIPGVPTDFLDELVYVLPYSEIPNDWHAREVVEFFIERGWTPPPEVIE